MKISVLNTSQGLVPLYDSDYDEKKKLRVGAIYMAEIKIQRNYKFHKKFFALINAGYALLPERAQNGFRTVDGFRQYVLVAAGYYDIYYSPRLREFVEIPKSISFASMDEAQFSECYNVVKNVIYAILGDKITEEIFESVLSNF